MSEKPRKSVKAEVNKNLDGDVKTAKDINPDPRPKRFEKEPNRYQKIVEAKKTAKREREEKKLAKPHIGNKKHIQKRWKAEAEQDQAVAASDEEEEEEEE
jgi:hypothetical protein